MVTSCSGEILKGKASVERIGRPDVIGKTE